MIVKHAARAAQAAPNSLQTAAVAGVASTGITVPTIGSTAVAPTASGSTSSGSSVPVGFSAVLLAVMLSTAGSAAAPRVTTSTVTRPSRLGGAAQHPGAAEDLQAALAGAAAVGTSATATVAGSPADATPAAPADAASPAAPIAPGAPVAVATDAPPTPALTASLPPVPPTPNLQPLGGAAPHVGASENLQAADVQPLGGAAPQAGASENLQAPEAAAVVPATAAPAVVVPAVVAPAADLATSDDPATTTDHHAPDSAPADTLGPVFTPSVIPTGLVATAPAPVAHAATVPTLHQAAPAAGTSGLANVDRVRSVRAMAPNREVQRLALDLDGSRVSVRFDEGHARVGVLADPDDTLGHGWVRQVERTIDQTVRATAAPTGGRSDQPAGDTSGDARQRRAHTQATLTERATEDHHRTRWARAARDLAVQSSTTDLAGVI